MEKEESIYIYYYLSQPYHVFCHTVHIHAHLRILACGRSRRRLTCLYRLQSTPPQKCSVARPLHLHLAGMCITFLSTSTHARSFNTGIRCPYSLFIRGLMALPLHIWQTGHHERRTSCRDVYVSLSSAPTPPSSKICHQGKNTHVPITDGALQILPSSLSNC
jgi:hypothetical protein